MPDRTYRQFSQDMRDAGWTNCGSGWWVHEPTKTSWDAWQGVRDSEGNMVEAWQVYADEGRLPEAKVTDG